MLTHQQLAQLNVTDRALLFAELRRRPLGDETPKPELPFPADISTADLFEFLYQGSIHALGVSVPRQDIEDVADAEVQRSAKSVAMVLHREALHHSGHREYAVHYKTYGLYHGLCPGQPFWDQPILVRHDKVECGTAFLVAPDVVVTASHVASSCPIDDLRFVFNHRLSTLNPGQDEDECKNGNIKKNRVLSFDENVVYAPAKVLGRNYSKTTGSDWAVIRLTRPVANGSWRQIRRSGTLDVDESVYAIGHASSLPMKYAGPGNNKDNSAAACFVVNLETYSGNSGSPVINSVTQEVEGILVYNVDPKDEYYPAGPCNKWQPCANDPTCRGRRAVRASEFAHCIP